MAELESCLLNEIAKRQVDSSSKLNVLLFAHRQADADALCAAAALYNLLKKATPMPGLLVGTIVAPRGASLLGESACKKLSIEFKESLGEKEVEDADLIVALDVGEPELLEPYLSPILRSRAGKILIDHHSSKAIGDSKATDESERKNMFDVSIVEPRATSTCEIIALGFEEKFLDKQTARILLTGIMFDSQHLGIATETTLEAVLRLLRVGARIDEVKGILRSRPDRSEIIARLKSAQRLQYKQVGRFVLASAQVSSFQASVARMLVEIGADIGVAYGEHEEEVRASARSTMQLFRDTGVDLGILMKQLGASLGMSGGGHSTAASLSGKGMDAKVVSEEIMKNLEKHILPQL